MIKEIEDIVKNKDLDRLNSFVTDNPSVLAPEMWAGTLSPMHRAAREGWIKGAMKFCVLSPRMGALVEPHHGTPYQMAKNAGHEELAESLRPFAFPWLYGADRFEVDPK